MTNWSRISPKSQYFQKMDQPQGKPLSRILASRTSRGRVGDNEVATMFTNSKINIYVDARNSDAQSFKNVWTDAVGRGSGAGAVSERTLSIVTQSLKKHS